MHLLVVANETVTGRKLIEAVERRKEAGDLQVTVVAPVSQPTRGYVVYEDTRRGGGRETARPNPDAPSRRGDPRARLRRGERSRDGGSRCSRPARASGGRDHPRDTPAPKIRLAPQERRGPDSRNCRFRSGRARGRGLDGRDGRQERPGAGERDRGRKGLARPNTRAQCPWQCELPDHLSAERPDSGRAPGGGTPTRRALAELRSEGIDAHGQIAQPDPFSAALDAVQEERVDEIIVSTFAPSRSPWLRKNLVQRLHDETKLPVEHIVFQPDQVEEGARA